MAPSVGLAMIVKDEALTLPRLAASLVGRLDNWTVVDTGSSDGTQDIARSLFADVPGEVVEEPWQGYGHGRTFALDAARRHTDWVLILDADDTFHGTIDADQLDVSDVVDADYRHGELVYGLPRLIRSSLPCGWKGRTHEYLDVPDEIRRTKATSFYVTHHADGANRGDKFERDLSLLRLDWDDQISPTRTAFYTARTYEDMGEWALAGQWYRRRLDLPGWDEESWYARWRLGRCLLMTGATDEACGVLWDAWAERPHRAEPLWTLAEHYRLANRWEAGWQACAAAIRRCDVEPWRSAESPSAGGGDRLFVHADVYQWRIAYEASIAAWYVDEHDLGRRAADHLLASVDLPADLRANVEANRRFYR